MEEIIKIEEKDGRKAVNARELHQFLENKRQFADWIKQRVEQYGFIENKDFEVFHKFVNNSNGGRPTVEYALSIEMAKELSMVENNEKGRIARKYFIACEEKLKQGVLVMPNFSNPAEAARACLLTFIPEFLSLFGYRLNTELRSRLFLLKRSLFLIPHSENFSVRLSPYDSRIP